MELRCTHHPGLPKFAWIADFRTNAAVCNVTCGLSVEIRDAFFVEGIWDQPFVEGAPHLSAAVFGSAGVRDHAQMVFVPSCATTDYLYYVPTGGICISNSLPLLLATVEHRLDLHCYRYTQINQSIKKGIRDYDPTIPANNDFVYRVLYQNILVKHGELTLHDKMLPPPFPDYTTYVGYLSSTVTRLLANARDPARQNSMSVFSTQSRGYDSTAVNALVSKASLDYVFTIPEPKEPSSDFFGRSPLSTEDDGTQICAALGLQCTKLNRRAFTEGDFSDEELFYAGLDTNQDLNLREIHRFVQRPTVLLTGIHGELWYASDSMSAAQRAASDNYLRRGDLSGHGLSEIRLHIGYVQMALPYLGSRRRTEIQAISDSEEMSAWRMHNHYDRPIARRIAEEAGVPRELFGQVKLGSVVILPSPKLPRHPALRTAYRRELAKKVVSGRIKFLLIPIVQRINSFISWKNPQRYFNNPNKSRILYYAARLWRRLTGRTIEIRPIWRSLDSALYAFCVNRVAESYKRALVDGGKSAASAEPRIGGQTRADSETGTRE